MEKALPCIIKTKPDSQAYKAVATPKASRSVKPVTRIDILPPELVALIVNRLSIPDAISLANHSEQSRGKVWAAPAVRHIFTYANHALEALEKTGCLERYTTRGIQATLMDHACAFYEEAKAYHLYLPTLQRVCGKCVTHNVALTLLLPHSVKRVFGLSHDEINRLPTFTVPRGSHYDYKARRKEWTVVALIHTRKEYDRVCRERRVVLPAVQARGTYTREIRTEAYTTLRTVRLDKIEKIPDGPGRRLTRPYLTMNGLGDEHHFYGASGAIAWPCAGYQ
jgi:hypothetical protein